MYRPPREQTSCTHSSRASSLSYTFANSSICFCSGFLSCPEPDSRQLMSVPRPAIFVAIVTEPLPRLRNDKSLSHVLAFNTSCLIPREVSIFDNFLTFQLIQYHKLAVRFIYLATYCRLLNFNSSLGIWYHPHLFASGVCS